MERLIVNSGHPTVKFTFSVGDNVYHVQCHYNGRWAHIDDALYCSKCSFVNHRAFERFGVQSCLDRLRDIVLKYGFRIPESRDTIRLSRPIYTIQKGEIK